MLVNQFSKSVDALAPTTNFPKLKAFLPQNLWPWIANYLKYVFSRRCPFQDYTGNSNTGVYAMGDSLKLAIAGDWGTGTDEAATVARLMDAQRADLTVHLGDVYYVGDTQEVDENCFGVAANGFDGVKWPHGTRGSFALNGNHEMYANGGPYFKHFLPSLVTAGKPQAASFFAIEAGAWRIIALDTGYNSTGIPILSMIPGLNSIPAIGGDCHLENAFMQWLRQVVQPKQNPKPTLLLSHHQYYTAFADHAYTKPAQQLKEFFDGQDVVWMWGHEHRLGIYDRFSISGGIVAFGRCAGHGGMPVDLGTPNPDKAPLQFYDPRQHTLDNDVSVGENGFVVATIEGSTLTLDYRDLNNDACSANPLRPLGRRCGNRC